MTARYKKNLKATAEIVAKNFRVFKKDLLRNAIALIGSILLLIVVAIAGIILEIESKMGCA
jgi:hypothetical protein